MYLPLPFNSKHSPGILNQTLNMAPPTSNGYNCVVMTDMSNRPASTNWQARSMSAIVKISVMVFLTMLAMVGIMGILGMLISAKQDQARQQHAQIEGGMNQSKWIIDLGDLINLNTSQPLIYFDPQEDLERPEFVTHYKKDLSTHDHFADLAQQEIASLEQLRARNLTFVLHVIGWKRRASLKRLVKSLEEAKYHGFKTKMHFHLDGEAHPLVTEFVEEYNWPHGKTLLNVHTQRLGLETVMKYLYVL